MTLTPGCTVEIVLVDLNGFLGRDHHPQASDVGLLGTVQVIERESDYRALDADEPDTLVLTCRTCEAVPRVLELVGHEVRVVGA